MTNSDTCQEEFFVTPRFLSTLRPMAEPLSVALERLLKETGLSQKAVSVRSGLSLEAVNRIVRGRTPDPQWGTMVALLRDGFGVSLDDFADGRPASPVTPYDANPEYRKLIDALETWPTYDRKRLLALIDWLMDRRQRTGTQPGEQTAADSTLDEAASARSTVPPNVQTVIHRPSVYGSPTGSKSSEAATPKTKTNVRS